MSHEEALQRLCQVMAEEGPWRSLCAMGGLQAADPPYFLSGQGVQDSKEHWCR